MCILFRDEEYYEAEKVLGRDVNEVFSIKSRAGAALESEAGKTILQASKKFISETELQEIKETASRSGRTLESQDLSKPLVQVLAEQRESKEQLKLERDKIIKQGKNKPLDEDEALFLESIATAEATQHKNEKEIEKNELEAFHRALLKHQTTSVAKMKKNTTLDEDKKEVEYGPKQVSSHGNILGKRQHTVSRPAIARIVRKKRIENSESENDKDQERTDNEILKPASILTEEDQRKGDVLPENHLVGLLSGYESEDN